MGSSRIMARTIVPFRTLKKHFQLKLRPRDLKYLPKGKEVVLADWGSWQLTMQGSELKFQMPVADFNPEHFYEFVSSLKQWVIVTELPLFVRGHPVLEFSTTGMATQFEDSVLSNLAFNLRAGLINGAYKHSYILPPTFRFKVGDKVAWRAKGFTFQHEKLAGKTVTGEVKEISKTESSVVVLPDHRKDVGAAFCGLTVVVQVSALKLAEL